MAHAHELPVDLLLAAGSEAPVTLVSPDAVEPPTREDAVEGVLEDVEDDSVVIW